MSSFQMYLNTFALHHDKYAGMEKKKNNRRLTFGIHVYVLANNIMAFLLAMESRLKRIYVHIKQLLIVLMRQDRPLSRLIPFRKMFLCREWNPGPLD